MSHTNLCLWTLFSWFCLLIHAHPSQFSAKRANNASSSVIYVNAAAATGGDGSSWSSAYSRLRAALVAASAGSQIWIAQGTYCPASSASEVNATFTIKKNNLAVYGGFQGTETSLDQRDPSLYSTILSGKYDDTANGVQHVVTITSINSIIDGITIKDGDSTGSDDGSSSCSDCFGAGIYFQNPLTLSATASANDFLSDLDENENDVLSDLNDLDASDVKYYLNLTNVTLSGHKAVAGAAMFLYADLVVTLDNCVITGNTAQEATYHVSGGAGIYASMAVELIIRNSVFSNNIAPHRGAAIYGDYGVDLYIFSCSFVSNIVSNGHGGAIYVTDRASNDDTTSATLISSTFEANKAAGFGGAVFLYNNCNGAFSSCSFTSNSAGASGGAVALYGAKSGTTCDSNLNNVYSFNSASNSSTSNCFETDFPDISNFNKITHFTPYLTKIYNNYILKTSANEPAERANKVFVDNSAQTSGTGLNWNNAVVTLQEAITLCTSLDANECEIWVRGGSDMSKYAPTKVPDWISTHTRYYDEYKSQTVDVEENVWIFGGFDGTETSRNERNFKANPTQISGIVTDSQGNEVSVYQVVHLQENSRIDGFIVSDGYGYKNDNTDTKNDNFNDFDGFEPIYEFNAKLSNFDDFEVNYLKNGKLDDLDDDFEAFATNFLRNGKNKESTKIKLSDFDDLEAFTANYLKNRAIGENANFNDFFANLLKNGINSESKQSKFDDFERFITNYRKNRRLASSFGDFSDLSDFLNFEELIKNDFKNPKILSKLEKLMQFDQDIDYSFDSSEDSFEEFEELGDSSSSSQQLHSMLPNKGNGIFANATCTIANVLIANNFGSIGAGLFVLYHEVAAENVGFINNYADARGGAVQADVRGTLTCNECFFELNVCKGKGGAVYLDYASKFYFYGNGTDGMCNFNNNTAYDGGGAISADGTSSVQIYCNRIDFESNYAFMDGGACYEGSYSSYGAKNRIRFVGVDEINYNRNEVYQGMGINDLFVWNFDSVSYPKH